MKYFNNCTTKEEVKSLFKTLAKEHHPDKGGDTATMQAINLEYAYAIANILKGSKLTSEEIESEILNAENYRTAINAIINLVGITIELCGGWIWVSGETYPHKDIFKANSFYFAGKKKMWYFRSVEYKTTYTKTLSMDKIRTKYGSQLVAGKQQKALA